jgi:hypothetical protein
MNVQAALKGQYHAALGMLKQAVEQCPDELWRGGAYPVPFWRVAYHTLFYTHLYLQPNKEDFHPWEHHREGHEELPWPPPAKPVCFPAGRRRSARSAAKEPPHSGPPESGPKTDDPYTNAQILDYWRVCDAMIDDAVDRLDLEAQTSGFPWHKTIPKLEHQIQHHAALLAGRLRLANGTDVRWVRSDGEVYKP